jgi:hypothetical protein
MKRYDNKTLKGLYWERPEKEWVPDLPAAVQHEDEEEWFDPSQAMQFFFVWTPLKGTQRYLTCEHLIQEGYKDSFAMAQDSETVVNRKGLPNHKIPQFAYYLRTLFYARLGLKMNKRTGLDESSVEGFMEALRYDEVPVDQIIDDWVEAERAAGFVVDYERETALRKNNPKADLRLKLAPDGSEVPLATVTPPTDLDAARAESVRLHGVTAARLADIETSLILICDRLGSIEQTLGKACAKQVLFAQNEIKVVEVLGQLKAQLNDIDSDVQDMLEGEGQVQASVRPTGPQAIGLIGPVAPQAAPQPAPVNRPVPQFKPDVDRVGDFGDAEAFSDMMQGK